MVRATGAQTQASKPNTKSNGTDIEDFLSNFQSNHPLLEQGLRNYALLVKNEDFHLYSVEKDGRPLVLKVMCDPDLFYAELAVFNRVEALQTGASDSEKIVLKLVNYF